jgi:hypothetical protein
MWSESQSQHVRILRELPSSKISVAKPGCPGMFVVMDWQEATALLIVAATAAAFAWGRFRPRKFSFKRDTHCGCSPSAADQPPPSIVFHTRKGGRTQITVRMK